MIRKKKIKRKVFTSYCIIALLSVFCFSSFADFQPIVANWRPSLAVQTDYTLHSNGVSIGNKATGASNFYTYIDTNEFNYIMETSYLLVFNYNESPSSYNPSLHIYAGTGSIVMGDGSSSDSSTYFGYSFQHNLIDGYFRVYQTVGLSIDYTKGYVEFSDGYSREEERLDGFYFKNVFNAATQKFELYYQDPVSFTYSKVFEIQGSSDINISNIGVGVYDSIGSATHLSAYFETNFFDESYILGYQDGYDEGYRLGLLQNQDIAYDNGYDDGFSDGESAGYDEGYTVGYVEGQEAVGLSLNI